MYALFSGNLLECYDELGTRYQLPVYVLSLPVNLVDESTCDTSGLPNIDLTSLDSQSATKAGSDVSLKFRFSNTGKDVKLTCRSTDTVLKIKRQLHEMEGVEPHDQRWCFGGRILSNKLRIEDANIPKGSLVQVIVSVVSPSDVTLQTSQSKPSKTANKPV